MKRKLNPSIWFRKWKKKEYEMKKENIQGIRIIDEMQDLIPWLIFELNQNLYTVNSRFITSIVIKPDEVTLVPKVKDYIEGLIHLRGNVIPLINLKSLLDIGDEFSENIDNKQYDEEMVVVFERENSFIGLLVDEVISVENISTYEETQEIKKMSNGRFVKGVAKGHKTNDVLLVIDEEKILRDA